MILTSKVKRLIALTAALVLLIVGYVILDKVVWNTEDQPPAAPITYTPPTLAPGEYFSTLQGTLSIYNHSTIKDLKSLQVFPGKDASPYLFSKNASGDLVLEGYEGLSLNSNTFSMLEYYACNPLTQKRITDGTQTNTVTYKNGTKISNAPLAQYGLSQEDNPAWYQATFEDGSSHKVYLGYQTPLQDGYYCRYEGRNEIYVLPAAYGVFFESKEYYVAPTVIRTNADSSMPYLDRFTISNFGKTFVDLKYSAVSGSVDGTLSLRFTADGEYDYLGNKSLMNEIFTSFSHLQGDRVLKLIPTDWSEEERILKMPALLEEYGLSQKADQNPFVVVYGFDGISKEDMEDAGIEGVEDDLAGMLVPVMFSKKSNNNTYNVLAIVVGTVMEGDQPKGVLYEQIVEISANDVPWLEYSSVSYVQQELYSNTITELGSISFVGNYLDTNGNKQTVDETFTLAHREITSVNAQGKTETKDVYSVLGQKSGLRIEEGNTTNFAMLYTVFMHNPRYFASLTDAQKATIDKTQDFMATITVTEVTKQQDGTYQEKQTLSFTYYRYSSTLAVVSLDGGKTLGYAVSFSAINEIIENAARVVAGEKVAVNCSNSLASLPGIIGRG